MFTFFCKFKTVSNNKVQSYKMNVVVSTPEVNKNKMLMGKTENQSDLFQKIKSKNENYLIRLQRMNLMFTKIFWRHCQKSQPHLCLLASCRQGGKCTVCSNCSEAGQRACESTELGLLSSRSDSASESPNPILHQLILRIESRASFVLASYVLATTSVFVFFSKSQRIVCCCF